VPANFATESESPSDRRGGACGNAYPVTQVHQGHVPIEFSGMDHEWRSILDDRTIIVVDISPKEKQMKKSLALVLVLCTIALAACTTTPPPTSLTMASPGDNGQFPGCRYQCANLDW
jgi:hypothetical protein